MSRLTDVWLQNVKPGWMMLLQPLLEKHEHTLQAIFRDDPSINIFPETHSIFRAFKIFDRDQLRVVILGQDPYINSGEADGLCFSVGSAGTVGTETCKTKMPPSLRNIFKELHRCYSSKRTDTCLKDWAEQGVLLLNTALTVTSGQSGSHTRYWRDFTRDLMAQIGEQSRHVVFLLWGAHAQSFERYIDTTNNLVLKHTHPSPLSRKPFVGNDHFLLTNRYLETTGRDPITWI